MKKDLDEQYEQRHNKTWTKHKSGTGLSVGWR